MSGKKCDDSDRFRSIAGDERGRQSNLSAGTGQLSSGSVNISTAAVPGGTYNLTARYGGDAAYNPSSSSAVPVTVNPEPSQTIVGVIGGGSFLTTPITVSYGEPLQVALVVAGNSGVGYPMGQMTLSQDGMPSVTLGAYGQKPSPLILNYGEKSTLLQGRSLLPASRAQLPSSVCWDWMHARKHLHSMRARINCRPPILAITALPRAMARYAFNVKES